MTQDNFHNQNTQNTYSSNPPPQTVAGFGKIKIYVQNMDGNSPQYGTVVPFWNRK